MDEIKLRVSGIEKSFPGVKALSNIDFAVRKGTVHALCGENGAGKSTLMKVLTGLYKADKGQIYIDEKPVEIKNPLQAREYGISMIAQELNYVSELSVEENLFMGRLPVNKFGKVDWKKVRREAEKFLEEEHLSYAPDQKLKTLTVSDIQMLEIIKAVNNNAQVVLMDEPTSSISQKEVKLLFEKIAELKAKGVSIIYISHKMDEVFQIADDITIIRDGAVVSSDRAENLDIETVIARMVGRKMDNAYPKEILPLGEKNFEVQNFNSKGMFADINFYARKGEIVGFAGLVGAGRTEVMRAIFGMDRKDSGTVKIDGQEVTIKSPHDAIAKKLIMLSEDRKEYGIIPVRSVMENASIASLKRYFYGGKNHRGKERKEVGEIFRKMNVKTPSLDTLIASLSGGNAQKVLLARWMLCDPEIMILDEPTRGIDVGAKFEIYKLMTDIVKEGKTIVMVSSELPELIGMCDRIYVMCQGRIMGCLSREEFSQETIMMHATGLFGKTGKGDK
ncbi:ABC transporter, ATP-binding protein [Marvinbryantia formatexigens DSM 14469]|uniref:ABC transporter, ATP-binding protein n=1 Tax=Marvinbryantia formatexigens DSM 14469 TaxID=478749 RepID=C6LFA0_9FIRM|nr:sugar ABC transporter ATP-binding protein [Marvinbryantia formatexigens]EET60839.1 ABC transporter, ATP-binding protein [Marvinbryantia formatexigens DSM 14469]UWO26832.1 sugar ABC transporter ATP-binding protein [Marvinbryantia formatexigens DSM 14469]SDH21354.1 monosaccharide ABC transporter ATP-binding protein, CUT2 family (TC 3.A.1.2.-) [Marvinbryantia formatexigens]